VRSNDLSWRHSLAVTLLLLSPFDLLASLGMDMYLPVVPSMAGALGADAATIQLTLTAYLVLIGAGQLVFGPLSDRTGRRPVLLAGALVYAGASTALALASSPGFFLAARVLQACGASACLVATFATVRDIYAGREEANVVYGLLGSMLAMVPALGPLVGALVASWFGWRAIFGLLGVAMLGMAALAWRFWPETRRRRTSSPRWGQLMAPLKSRDFWLYTLCYSAGMGSFFVFFSTAPWLMMDRHGLSQLAFSLVFGTVAIAMAATARVMGRLVPRWGTLRTLRAGMGCLLAGALLLAAGETWMPGPVLGFIAPMWLVAGGIAAAVSVAPNGALRGFDHIAGTATAVYFCLGGLLLGSIATVVLALLPRDSAWPVVAYASALAAAVLCLSRWGGDRAGGGGDGGPRPDDAAPPPPRTGYDGQSGPSFILSIRRRKPAFS
jgi:DHA1 family florfenicol/chloramphenicol resistance protein-like MFS transporter